MADSTPFSEDQMACYLADVLGLELVRVDSIEITDEKAICEAGLMRKSPDYPRIRKALKDGLEVPGARWRGVEYRLRRNG